jgi:hypothetical protein
MRVFVGQAEGGGTAVVALVVTVLAPLRSSSANLAGWCVSRGVCGRVYLWGSCAHVHADCCMGADCLARYDRIVLCTFVLLC